MAYGKRSRKSSFKRRKTYPRKRSSHAPSRRRKVSRFTAITSLTAPIAPPYRTSMLTYYESGLSLNPSTGSTATWVFRANDLFDPNLSGTGKQPMNFDQWMTLYGRATVLWSQIEVWASSQDASRMFTVTVLPSIASSVTATADTLQETPGARFKTFTGFQASKAIGYVKNSRKTRTMFGLKDVIDEKQFACTLTTNTPTDYTWYWIIQVQSADAAIDPSPIGLQVRIKYITRFTERLNKLSS